MVTFYNLFGKHCHKYMHDFSFVFFHIEAVFSFFFSFFLRTLVAGIILVVFIDQNVAMLSL